MRVHRNLVESIGSRELVPNNWVLKFLELRMLQYRFCGSI